MVEDGAGLTKDSRIGPRLAMYISAGPVERKMIPPRSQKEAVDTKERREWADSSSEGDGEGELREGKREVRSVADISLR